MSYLVQWTDLLRKIDFSQANHSYVYEMQGEETGTVLLTKAAYDAYLKQKSSSKTKYIKLSLKEIVNLSKHLISNPDQGAQSVIMKLYLDNTVSSDFKFETFFTELQKEAQDNIKQAKAPLALHNILKQMCDRARAKRVAAATQGVWGKIKYYIWSWFCDQSYRLKEEPRVKEACSAEKYIENALKSAASTLQSRILNNMSYFEEEIRIPEENRNQPNRNGFEKFATPNDIGKKWLTRFAEDKMPRVSEDAQNYRKRILHLRKIWQDVIAKQEELSISAAPTTATVSSPQIPFLESNS
jgi:hypothetical protein